MGKTIEVSIISTTFNRSLQLRRGIFTLLKQPTSIPYEVIIVDDGSTDDTKGSVEVLIALGKKREVEIKYIYLDCPHHRICCYPKNVGIRRAVGDILVFCEPEMLHIGRTLDQLVEKLKESFLNVPIATQIWSMGEFVYKELSEENFINPQTILNHPFAQLVSGPGMVNTRAPNARWAISGHKRTLGSWFFACLKEDIVEIGGWDEELEGYGFDDFDLFHRLMAYGKQLLWCEDIIVIHQWHEKDYPFDIHVMADKNRMASMARIAKGEFRANIGKEWGRLEKGG
jgi:glycosyltransferase involved in cell wall biosynthesis